MQFRCRTYQRSTSHQTPPCYHGFFVRSTTDVESSADVRERVIAAQKTQLKRYAGEKMYSKA
jgi:predicted ATPase with chaperone activity